MSIKTHHVEGFSRVVWRDAFRGKGMSQRASGNFVSVCSVSPLWLARFLFLLDFGHFKTGKTVTLLVYCILPCEGYNATPMGEKNQKKSIFIS